MSPSVAVLDVPVASIASMMAVSTVITSPKVSPKIYKTLAPICARYVAPGAPRRRRSRFRHVCPTYKFHNSPTEDGVKGLLLQIAPWSMGVKHWRLNLHEIF